MTTGYLMGLGDDAFVAEMKRLRPEAVAAFENGTNVCGCEACERYFRIWLEKVEPSAFGKATAPTVEIPNSTTGGQEFDVKFSDGSGFNISDADEINFRRIFGDTPRSQRSEPPAALDAIDDWSLATKSPVASGFMAYFPHAIAMVAQVSAQGNRQHGTDGWDKSRSADEINSLGRHFLAHLSGEPLDTDGHLHLAKVAWRAMAALERALTA